MEEQLISDFNELVLQEQKQEKERMDYHMRKDNGAWIQSKNLVNQSRELSPNDPYLYDFMAQYVVESKEFLREIEGIRFFTPKTGETISLTGPEARHFVENYKIPSTLPSQNMLYSMIYGKPDTSPYDVYIYVYFDDTIVDFTNNWRDTNPRNAFTIIPRHP